VKEGLAPKHGRELLWDALEELLDRGWVPDESGGHLETSRGNITDCCLDVVGDPLDEIRRVLVLDRQHLVVNFLHRHSSSEHRSNSQVSKKCLDEKSSFLNKLKTYWFWIIYRPCLGSHAAIIFLASNICCVSSGTVSARYCCEPRDVSGAKPGMKKCRRGKGTFINF